MRRLHWRALNKALSEAGLDQISHEDHVTRFDGLSTRTKLEMLGVPQWLRDTVADSKQAHTLKMVHEEVRPDPRLLGELAKIEQHLFIGVVSNALLDTCVPVLMRSGLGRHVKLLIAGPHQFGKPHPSPYLKAITAAHLDPNETVAVEDNHYGVQSADAAGLSCIEVTGPKDITFDLVMRAFAQVPA